MNKDDKTPKQRLDRVSPISESGRNQSCSHVDKYETVQKNFQLRSPIAQPFSVEKSKQTHVILTEDQESETHSQSSLTDSAYQTPEDQESETHSQSSLTDSAYQTPEDQESETHSESSLTDSAYQTPEDQESETHSASVTDSTYHTPDDQRTGKERREFIAKALAFVKYLNQEDHKPETHSDPSVTDSEDQMSREEFMRRCDSFISRKHAFFRREKRNLEDHTSDTHSDPSVTDSEDQMSREEFMGRCVSFIAREHARRREKLNLEDHTSDTHSDPSVTDSAYQTPEDQE